LINRHHHLSNKLASVVERQSRQAAKQLAGIAIANIDQQITAPGVSLKNVLSTSAVEAGHRSGIQPSPAGGNKISACMLLLRNAVSSASSGLEVNQLRASP
jgi:hypothetical protein